MAGFDIGKLITNELQKLSPVLESAFHNMVDIEFTVEDGKFYLLTARAGKRTAVAGLKIVMSMFCEGKINIEDVIINLPGNQIEELINRNVLTNADEIEEIAVGLPASNGAGTGIVCFSYSDAMRLISNNKDILYCRCEVSPEDVDVMRSPYCKGVLTAYGGMTSHAAVYCRGMGIPCVSGIGDYNKVKIDLNSHRNIATIDGSIGVVYGGTGKIEKSNVATIEINMLYKLLKLIIKYNAVSPNIYPLVWRLWDIIVFGKQHGKNNCAKCLVDKKSTNYISFSNPSKSEINEIDNNLFSCKNSEILVEDLIEFMISQLSAHVSLGSHFLYMRPLLNPLDAMRFITHGDALFSPPGYQITGVEFFNVNQFINFMIDIRSIKIYFSTQFYVYDENADESEKYFPLNFLDFTNPKGEGLIINTYNAKSILVYINDVLIPAEELPMVYHFLRRRAYHWTWYEENNISRSEIKNYLESNCFIHKTKLYYLCEEMHLIDGEKLTRLGASFIGRN